MAAAVMASFGFIDHPHVTELDEAKNPMAAHISPNYHLFGMHTGAGSGVVDAARDTYTHTHTQSRRSVPGEERTSRSSARTSTTA